MHLRLVYIIESNTLNLDQTTHMHFVCNIGYLSTYSDKRADDKSRNCGKRVKTICIQSILRVNEMLPVGPIHLTLGNSLVHSERRTADISALNFMA